MKRKTMRFAVAPAFVLVLLWVFLPPAGDAKQARKPPASSGTEHMDAATFDGIARTLFKPIYYHLARQVKQDYGVVRGRCLDAGAGPAYLAIELAKITELEVIALDIDPQAVEIARRNVKAAGLSGRVKPVAGDVQNLDLPDGSVDLIVSRGSYIFWKDKVRAFQELRRVLKPGGVAFVGGGMGDLLPSEERARIQETMAREKIGPPEELKMELGDMAAVLRRAGIKDFAIRTDEGCLCGLWVEFRKPRSIN